MRLSIRDIQNLLASASVYTGGIDGDAGPLTRAAADAVIKQNPDKVPKGLRSRRRLVAAAQLVLRGLGYDPGVIDGYDGHNTSRAFDTWSFQRVHGKNIPPPTTSEPAAAEHHRSARWPTQKDVREFYGPVGENQTRIDLPYPFRLSWNQRQTVTRMTCHERVADSMLDIFTKVLETYKPENIRKLNLDQFGGCLNVRRIRGGQQYSMHSWGIAVDMDPVHNQFRWGRDRAAFARTEYDDYWSIVEGTGAISLGRSRNFDWMHFQFARLDPPDLTS